jgi:plasmid stabilization system protein ParE
MHRLSVELEKVLMLISRNPKLFPKSEFKEVRRAVIKKFNILYYRENDNRIEIISFFSNRQAPDKREI